MPNDAITNSAPAESASATPSTDLNNPANLDFEDELDNAPVNETKPEAGTDPESEPDEAEDDTSDQEAEESDDDATAEAETEDDAENAPVEVNVPDEALVTLPGGQKVKFSDLKKGYMQESDYTRSKQGLANDRRALSEQANRIQSVTDTFVNFLAQQLPEAPDQALAFSNPAEYMQKKVMHDAAMERVQGLIALGTQAKAEAEQISSADHAEAMARANDVILEKLPQLRNPAEREKANQAAWEAAQFIGYSPDGLKADSDPRVFIAAYYAAKGIKAEKAQKTVAQKVSAAPKSAPVKNSAAAKGNPQFLRNKEAMRRLSKSGSIKDALAIDFE